MFKLLIAGIICLVTPVYGCIFEPAKWGQNMDEQIVRHMKLVKNDKCEIANYVWHTAGVNIVLVDIRIVQQAKNGRAGASQTNTAYLPNKDFVGRDTYIHRITFKRNNVIGYAMITTHVIVKEGKIGIFEGVRD